MTALPADWTTPTIAEIATEGKGTVNPVSGTVYELYSVPSMPTGRPEHIPGNEIGSTKRAVRPGDVLLCKINPRINRVWVVGPGDTRPQIASTEWLVLTPSSCVLSQYLMWYLRSPYFRRWITANVEGATGSHTRAKSPSILLQRVPLPPLQEQGRIVAAIEEEISRIDAGAASLSHIVSQMIKWKTAHLASALPTKQEGWGTIQLGQVLSNTRYGTSAKSIYGDAGVPVLRIPNIRGGRIDFSDLKFIADPYANLTSAWASPGDVLIIRSNGSRSLIGRAAPVPRLSRRIAFASYLISLTPVATALLPEFLALALDGPGCRAQLERMAASTAGQYNLSAAKLRQLRLTLPPLEEQRRLVAQFSDFAVRTSAIARAVSTASRRTSSLRRVILAEAFSGAWADAA